MLFPILTFWKFFTCCWIIVFFAFALAFCLNCLLIAVIGFLYLVLLSGMRKHVLSLFCQVSILACPWCWGLLPVVVGQFIALCIWHCVPWSFIMLLTAVYMSEYSSCDRFFVSSFIFKVLSFFIVLVAFPHFSFSLCGLLLWFVLCLWCFHVLDFIVPVSSSPLIKIFWLSHITISPMCFVLL